MMFEEHELQALTLDELSAHRLAVQNEIDEMRQYARLITRVYDAKAQMSEAQRMADTMSDEKKRALLQVLQPTGIASEEKFGNIGGQ